MTEVFISPSQIATALRCMRKWGFDKIARLPRKTNAAAEFGSVVHKHLEIFGNSHKMPPNDAAGSVAKAITAKGYVPGPDHRVYYEGKNKNGTVLWSTREDGMFVVDFPGVEGAKLIGYIDQQDERDSRVSRVIDYKTTSNARYAKSAKQLATDPQSLAYSYFAHKATNKAVVDFSLVYVETKMAGGQRAPKRVFDRNIRHVPESDDFKAAVAGTLTVIGKEIAAARALPVTVDSGVLVCNESLPKNEDACWDFGGCPYQSHCSRGNWKTRARKPERKNTMGLLDEVLAEKVTSAKTSKTLEEINKEKTVNQTAPRRRGRPKGAKNKPKFVRICEEPDCGKEFETPKEDVFLCEEHQPKAKRGRPKKPKAGKVAKEVVDDKAPARELPQPDVVTNEPASPIMPAHSFIVYIDAVPVGPYVNFEFVLANYLSPNGTPWDVADLDLHYVDRKAALRANVSDMLKTGALDGQSLVVSSASPSWQILSDILMPSAFIVRGTR